MKIAVIGLGNMGQPIAQNVLQAGYRLTVYNRTKEKTEEFGSQGAQVAETPRQAAETADIVVTMLSDDNSVSAVTFGKDGLIEGLSENGIHISMSTISVECAGKTRCRSKRRASDNCGRTRGSKKNSKTSARKLESASV